MLAYHLHFTTFCFRCSSFAADETLPLVFPFLAALAQFVPWLHFRGPPDSRSIMCSRAAPVTEGGWMIPSRGTHGVKLARLYPLPLTPACVTPLIPGKVYPSIVIEACLGLSAVHGGREESQEGYISFVLVPLLCAGRNKTCYWDLQEEVLTVSVLSFSDDLSKILNSLTYGLLRYRCMKMNNKTIQDN